jgi:hypothetical protein
MIQFRISKLIRLFPPRARTRFDYAFYFEGPAKIRQQSHAPPPQNNSYPKDKKLIAFSGEKKRMKTRFLSSSHLKKTYVKNIIKTGQQENFVIIDSSNTLALVSLPLTKSDGTKSKPMPVRKVTEIVTTSCGLSSTSSFLLGLGTGEIEKFDIVRASGSRIGAVSNRTITVLEPFGSTDVLVGSSDGTLSRLDMREATVNQITMSATFDGFRGVSAIAVWPNGGAAAAVGFAGGSVVIFDLRTWLPIWSDKTRRVEHILPMATDTPGLSYLLINEEAVEIVVEPRFRRPEKPRSSLVYYENTHFRMGFPYLGGAVVVDDASASFIHGCDAPLYRLFDLTSYQIKNSDSQIRKSKKLKPSLHKHDGIIVCGTIIEDTVVTCDDLGFINQWRLAPRRHRRSEIRPHAPMIATL